MTEANVFQLSQPGTFADPLTEVLRNGARALLAKAIEAEVAALLAIHADKLTEDGRQRLVRHGHLPEREIMTGIGSIAVRCPRVRDRVGEGAERRDLRDSQAKLLEVIPRLMNARAVLGRMEIRSPYAGQVVGLSMFSVGGVIARGEKILDVVPDLDSLIIEAHDISDVHPDMRADVHLTAYKARITPVVRGKLTQVSADRLTDNRTGTSYYTAFVQVDQSEFAELPNVRLYPGMPAMVMFPTIERTALDYMVGPLTQSFNRAFRQK